MLLPPPQQSSCSCQHAKPKLLFICPRAKQGPYNIRLYRKYRLFSMRDEWHRKFNYGQLNQGFSGALGIIERDLLIPLYTGTAIAMNNDKGYTCGKACGKTCRTCQKALDCFFLSYFFSYDISACMHTRAISGPNWCIGFESILAQLFQGALECLVICSSTRQNEAVSSKAYWVLDRRLR